MKLKLSQKKGESHVYFEHARPLKCTFITRRLGERDMVTKTRSGCALLPRVEQCSSSFLTDEDGLCLRVESCNKAIFLEVKFDYENLIIKG